MTIEEFSNIYGVQKEQISEYMNEKKTFFNKHPLDRGHLPIVAQKALEERFKVNETTTSATNISNVVAETHSKKIEKEKEEAKAMKKTKTTSKETTKPEEKTSSPKKDTVIADKKETPIAQEQAKEPPVQAEKPKKPRKPRTSSGIPKITIVKPNDLLTSKVLGQTEMRQILVKTETTTIENIAFMSDADVSNLFDEKLTGIKTKENIYVIKK